MPFADSAVKPTVADLWEVEFPVAVWPFAAEYVGMTTAEAGSSAGTRSGS